MKFLRKLTPLILLLSFATLALLAPPVSQASNIELDCSTLYGSSTTTSWPDSIPLYTNNFSVTFHGPNWPTYKISCKCSLSIGTNRTPYQTLLASTQDASDTTKANVTNSDWGTSPNSCTGNLDTCGSDNRYITIENGSASSVACTIKKYSVTTTPVAPFSCTSSDITFTDQNGKSGCFQVGDTVNWSFNAHNQDTSNNYVRYSYINGTVHNPTPIGITGSVQTDTNGAGQKFSFTVSSTGANTTIYCSRSINILAANSCSRTDKNNPPGGSDNNPPPVGTVIPFDFCTQAADSTELGKCNDCKNSGGLWTALGCIPTNTQGLVSSLLTIGLGLSGGVVLLSILAGAFMMATSAGEPKKVQEAQEIISAAVIGLLFVIFSVIILKFVGVTILNIPGFGQ